MRRSANQRASEHHVIQIVMWLTNRFFSSEPGAYLDDKFGIRIETMVVVINKSATDPTHPVRKSNIYRDKFIWYFPRISFKQFKQFFILAHLGVVFCLTEKYSVRIEWKLIIIGMWSKFANIYASVRREITIRNNEPHPTFAAFLYDYD